MELHFIVFTLLRVSLCSYTIFWDFLCFLTCVFWCTTIVSTYWICVGLNCTDLITFPLSFNPDKQKNPAFLRKGLFKLYCKYQFASFSYFTHTSRYQWWPKQVTHARTSSNSSNSWQNLIRIQDLDSLLTPLTCPAPACWSSWALPCGFVSSSCLQLLSSQQRPSERNETPVTPPFPEELTVHEGTMNSPSLSCQRELYQLCKSG